MSLRKTAEKLEAKAAAWTPQDWDNWARAIQGVRDGLTIVRAHLALVPDNIWPEITDLGFEAFGLRAFGKKWSTMVGTVIDASPRVVGQQGAELREVANGLDAPGPGR